MRFRVLTVISGFVFTLAAATGSAGVGVWTTNGPPGGALSVATDPGIPGVVYTAAFRSLDDGKTWQSYGLNPPNVLGAVTSGTTATVYVGGSSADDGAVLSSSDAGAHWTLASTIPNPYASITQFSYVSVDRLFGDPMSSAVVYAAVRNVLAVGLFNEERFFERSADGGQTWNTTGLSVGLLQGVDLAINPANTSLLLAALYGGPGFGAPDAVYRSLDAGASWTQVTSLANPTFSVRFDPHVSSVAYALGAGGFYKSTDGGVTFATVSSSFTNGARLVVSTTQSGRFFATLGNNAGVVTSSDGGVTWNPLGEGLPQQGIYDLTIDPAGTHLYAATTTGVFVLDLTDPGTLTLNATHPFTVSLSATDPHTGQAAPGVATQANDLWGYFSIPAITHNPNNPEVFVKLLDGTAINGEYWFFYGGLTNLEYTLTVTDVATRAQKTYTNPAGSECGGSDTAAFAP
jgi:photosystem II stability/assembly factor-like uncharacterized protein